MVIENGICLPQSGARHLHNQSRVSPLDFLKDPNDVVLIPSMNLGIVLVLGLKIVIQWLKLI